MPGAVFGILGLLAVVGSIIYAATSGHPVAAGVLGVITLAFVPMFFILWKSVLAKVMALKDDQKGYRPSTTVTEELVGAEGEAVTQLRPSGIARLNERRYDVVTRGEMIEKGTPIKVIEVSGNRIVVRSI